MAQYLQADSPIDPLTVDGTELAARLNRLVDAIDSDQSGNARPATLTAGGIYTKTSTGGEMSVMLYDGTSEHVIGGKYGYIMSKPPAGSTQSITAGAPGDVPLTIKGAASQNADLLHVGGTRFVITSDGKVGINTPNPAYPFVVSSQGGAGLEVAPSTTAGVVRLIAFDRIDTNYAELILESDSFTVKKGAVTTRLRLDPDGMFGIGTATPTAGLDINTTAMPNGLSRVGFKLTVGTGHVADLIQVGPFVVNRDGKIKLPAATKTALTNASTIADLKAVLQQIFV